MMIRVALAAIAFIAFAAVDRAQSPARKPVSFAILEDYDKDADLAEVERDFKLFQSLEISTWRGSFGWDDYEPERGRDDFAWLHRFAALADRYRITLRPYIGRTPEWAARKEGRDGDVWNNPAARPQDWERFTGALAAALAQHPNVRSFEIYNEENAAQWWDGTPEDYGRTLVGGSRAIRARNGGAAVVFGGLTYPDVSWIERVCAVAGAPRAFSVLAIHAYPESRLTDVTVENYLDQLTPFLETADRLCGRKTIWINEAGFPTDATRGEREQAYWWVRAVATFLAHPRVEQIGVYEIKDLAPGSQTIGDATDFHLGITRADRTPKIAFYTIDLLTDLLNTATTAVADDDVRLISGGEPRGDLHYHLFTRPDGDRVLVIWDRSSARTVGVAVPGIQSSTEFDVDGRALHYTADAAAVLRSIALMPGVPRIFRLMPPPR